MCVCILREFSYFFLFVCVLLNDFFLSMFVVLEKEINFQICLLSLSFAFQILTHREGPEVRCFRCKLKRDEQFAAVV